MYEGIFEQYGYDTDDSSYSLEYYLEDPARMEKIMEKVGDRLKDEAEGGLERSWKPKLAGKSFLRLYSLTPDSPQPQPGQSPLTRLDLVQFEQRFPLLYPARKR